MIISFCNLKSPVILSQPWIANHFQNFTYTASQLLERLHHHPTMEGSSSPAGPTGINLSTEGERSVCMMECFGGARRHRSIVNFEPAMMKIT